MQHNTKINTNKVNSSKVNTTKPLSKGSTNLNPADLDFCSLIKEDFATHENDFFSQGFWAVFNHRFGNWRMGLKPKLLRIPFTILYRTHRKLIQMLAGIQLDYTVQLGRRVKIEHFGGIIISAKAIGDDVIIRQNTTLGIKNLKDLEAKPTIENNVSIGAGAVIIGDIVIGHHCVIGPNTVIYQSLPPHSTAYPSIATVITRPPNSD